MIRAGPPIILSFLTRSPGDSAKLRDRGSCFRSELHTISGEDSQARAPAPHNLSLARLNPTPLLWHHLSMPKIHIPTPLRQYAGKQPAVDVKGSTVAEALSGLVSQHPDLRRHLYTEDGKLRAFVNVYLNDEDVRYLQKEATAVKDGDDISIVPSIAGGTEIEKLGNLANWVNSSRFDLLSVLGEFSAISAVKSF
jgi:sulfur-carrier protein